MLLVAEHQGQRLFGPQYFLEWLALPGSSADHAIAAAQPLQRVRKPDSTIQLYILHSALGHAIARVRRSRLRRMVREHDPRQGEESGGARNGAEIVRIADAVEKKERRAAACPVCNLGEVEDRHGLRLRQHDHTTMHDRLRDALELGSRNHAIGLVCTRELRAEVTDL